MVTRGEVEEIFRGPRYVPPKRTAGVRWPSPTAEREFSFRFLENGLWPES
jgi:hypothetical protein